MAMIANAKYYTPTEVADYCVKKTLEVLGRENIDCWIEPSAGGGAFLDSLEETGLPYEAYDILPDDPRVKEMNFFHLGIPTYDDEFYLREYSRRRVCIGNPPFNKAHDVKQFFNKAVTLCGHIAWILPISYFENNTTTYKFDTIYEEDLGNVNFCGRDVHVCFKIMSEPLYGWNAKPALEQLICIETYSTKNSQPFVERPEYYINVQRRNNKNSDVYTSEFVRNNLLKEDGTYLWRMLGFYINDDCTYRDEFLDFLGTFDFEPYVQTATFKIVTRAGFFRAIKDTHPEWIEN